MTELSIILPVHNEETIISAVYAKIRYSFDRLTKSSEYILVENGSTDASPEEIKKLVKTYPHTYYGTAPKGYGSAILAGLASARGIYVCYMPSDGQINLSTLPLLWKKIKSGKWDIVKIKRINRESWIRSATSWFFSFCITVLFGIPRLDINGSPRILKRELITALHLTSTDSFIDAEMAIKAYYRKLKICEVPTKTLARAGGTSTRSWKTYAEFIKNIYLYRRGSIE